jgi:diguanylate cyclase
MDHGTPTTLAQELKVRNRVALAMASLLPAFGLAGIYFVCVQIAAATVAFAGGVTLFWPANAIVAALLIRQRQVSLLVTLVALLLAGPIALHAALDTTWQMGLGFTAVNLVEIAASVYAFRVLLPLPFPKITIWQATSMTLIMGVVITGVSATLGGLMLNAAYNLPLGPAILNWWGTDALNACVLVPPIVLFGRDELARLLRPRYRWFNLLMIPTCVLTTWLSVRYVHFPFILIALVPMVASYHVGGFGASLLTLVNAMTVIALWLLGIRPMGLDGPSANLYASLPVIALVAATMPPIAVGMGTDVRRGIQRALRASEQRFRESMENSPLGMIMLDRNGQWSFTNTAMREMLGYTQDEFSQLGIDSLAHPDELHDVWERWGKLLSRQIDSYKITRRFLHRSGRWIWVDCAVSLARDEYGRPLHFVAQVESLEERRRAEADLAAERELLKITLASIGDAVITADPQGRVTFANDAALSLLGRAYGQMGGKELQELLQLTDTETSAPAVGMVDRCRVSMAIARRTEPCALTRPDGSTCYVTDTVTPVLRDGRELTGFVMVLHDVTVSLERTRALRQRADHDSLTSLLNRPAFQRSLHQAFVKHHSDGTPATLVMLDLDRFKAVNDTAGHAAGDAVLRHFAAVLRRSVRPTDVIGRLGGDEFVVLLNNCDELRSHEIGQRLLGALNPLRTSWEGVVHATGASLGVARCSFGFADPEDWIRAADDACYESKRAGRGVLRSWLAA